MCRCFLVVFVARVGVLVFAGALLTSCVNLSYPPGATTDGGRPFVAHLGNGRACALPSDCQSGFCADGFCCKTACDATCFTCAKPGNEGVCIPADSGSNPRGKCADEGAGSCGLNGLCDGAGACQKYPVGAVCQAAGCLVQQVMLAGRCMADGTCMLGTQQKCFPYLCDEGGQKCRTDCTDSSQCANGVECIAGSCGKTKALGNVCGTAAECDSGFCSQGVCCAVDCAGGCRSCALKGNEGACTNVPAGTKADVCKASDAATCGLDGTCDGAGACRNYVPGAVCGPSSCTSATLRAAGTCDGQTHCQVPTVTSTCGGYTCGSTTACRTTCASDGECAPPSVCGQGSCGGLTGQYFKQTTLNDLAFTRTDPNINFNWGGGSPSSQLNNDNFSIRWRGKITARFSEPYTFYAATDDGERLIIGGVVVIDHFIRHSTIPEDVTMKPIMMKAGQPIDIEFDYFENGGDASTVLSWSSSVSEPKAVIPTSAFAPQ